MDELRLRELIRIAQENDLEELEVAEGDSRIRIRLRTAGLPIAPATMLHAVASAGVARPDSAESAAEKGLVAIESPIVGTFYRAPAPDADPYAEIGEEIEVGQVVAIVEAMKVMNEIQSTVAGRVVSIPVENGEPVEYGQPLFWIDPSGKTGAEGQ
jgi:acetyl-CoA carboxylase biotin carboxyl carrier protein